MPRLPPLNGTLLIAGLALLAYRPSLNGGFILDDDVYLTDCPTIAASDGLYSYWCTSEPVDYYPVFNTMLWIEWRLWGPHPAGYRAINLLLHIVSALLVWMILQKLSIPGAFLAALLFAVHPVNVESVAWVVQRKNTLSMFFFLLSVLWYLKAAEGNRAMGQAPNKADDGKFSLGRWYWLSVLAFLLAMLSKGSVAVLPLVLLLLVWWKRQRVTLPVLARTAPFFMVAAVLTGVNLWFQTHGTGEVIRSASYVERLVGAGAVVWFYLSKALLPINLVFVYPLWHIQTSDVLWWLPLVVTLAVTGLLIWRKTKWSRAYCWLGVSIAWHCCR